MDWQKQLSEPFDVAVVGGGPAGVVAAIASARNGANTILIEQHGFLGGCLTACGTGPMMSFHAGETQVVKGIADEIVERMKTRGFSQGHAPDAVGFCATTTAFDAEGLKLVLEEMAEEAGVTLLYHTTYIGCETEADEIRTLKLYAKGGVFSLRAAVYVDASADADLAVDAGVPAVYGREADGMAQPMTLNAKVYNVDREKLCRYIMAEHADMSSYAPENLDAFTHYDLSGCHSLMQLAKERGELHLERDMALCFETNQQGEYIVNMSRILKCNVLDPLAMTQAEIRGRRQVQEIVAFLRRYVPGFEACRLAFTGPNIGVRESRKIRGVYCLTAEDLLANRMFDDAVSMGGYPIDVHNPNGEKTAYQFLKPGSWYSIPYRALISREMRNLIVTGRCLSSTQEANAAVRVTPIVMGFSQGAGTAAALCARAHEDVRLLNIKKLREALCAQGVFLTAYEA